MDIVFWPHTRNKKIASYRLRCLQIVESLQQRGMSAGLYHSNVKPKILVLSKRYDASTIQKSIDLREKYGTQLVLDVCDNHFYYEKNSDLWAERAKALNNAVLSVDIVTCSSEALAKIVIQQTSINASKVRVIGDSIELPFEPDLKTKLLNLFAQTKFYIYKKKLQALHVKDGRRLIWFGNHGGDHANGGMQDILIIKDQLLVHHHFSPISLTIVSNNQTKYEQIAREIPIPTIYIEWDNTTFSKVLSLNDIAIIPITSNPFTLCKTNNRLATAIVHDLQVAATSIPSYEIFRYHIALDDWINGMQTLLNDKKTREDGIKQCKQIIEQHYSRSKVIDRWQSLLLEIAER